jgi:hypothetical protein
MLPPAPFRWGRAGAGQFPQPGQLGLQLPGLFLQLQDTADAGQVQPVGAQMIVSERPYGAFTRQVFLGATLDAENIAADYAAGVV